MEIIVDSLTQKFQLSDDIQTSEIWETLIEYLVDHNRILMNAEFEQGYNTIEINTLQSLAQVLALQPSDIIKVKIKTLPAKPAIQLLFKNVNALKIRIVDEIFTPIQQILDNSSEDETGSVKLDLFQRIPKKLELLSEMNTTLFKFIFVKKFSDVRKEAEILEELIQRIQKVIQHQDMSTLVHLLSYELIQLLEKLNKRLSSEITHFAI